MATIYAKNKNTGEWERVGPAAAATDATLTLSGSPADAKVTGDAIRQVQDKIDGLTAADVGALPADTEIPSVEGLASEAYVNERITEVVSGAPELLNTLDELSAALNDDENFATTVANRIAEKQDKLTFDETPTEGSANPVTSGGIKSYIDAVYIPFTINSGSCILDDNYTYANISSMLENNKTVLLYTAADSEGITKFIFKFNIKNLDTDKNMYYLEFNLIQNDGASNIIVYSVFIYEDNTVTFHSPRLVTNARKINGKNLSADIVLTAEDIGALPSNTVIPSIEGLASEIYVNNKITEVVGSAPELLNTLDELSAALNDDENFANTITTELSKKANSADLGALALKNTVEKTDLASDVQTSLGKADTALQSYTETDPTVPDWAKAETKPSYDFSELTVNDPEAAKTALAIEKGMVLKELEISLLNASDCITYGNGKFVSMYHTYSGTNTMAYSEDGINWTTSTMPSEGTNWYSVIYGNGKFVAVSGGYSASDIAAYSEDGINWSASTMPSSVKWRSVTYGNGKFVAVASDTDIAAYSEDGINWSASTMPSSVKWRSVTYGNGKFVAVNYDDRYAAYSEDGINWFSSTMPNSTNWSSVTYGNGKFVAFIFNGSTTAYSEDGINWSSSRSLTGITNWYSVVYDNGKFVAVASGAIAYSEDGITWKSAIIPAKNKDMAYVAYGNGKFVALSTLSGYMLYSYDGITWHDSIQYISQNDTDVTADTLVALKHTHPEYLEAINEIRNQVNIRVPAWTEADEGKVLRIVNGVPTWTTIANAEGSSY